MWLKVRERLTFKGLGRRGYLLGLYVVALLGVSAVRAAGCETTELTTWTEYYARGFGLDPDLLRALIWTESRFCVRAVSPKGAIGLGQLMPATAAELGVDPGDVQQNLWGAAKYLRERYDEFGDWRLALAAYNAGPGNVRRYGGIPPFAETQRYVEEVLDAYARYRRRRGTVAE